MREQITNRIQEYLCSAYRDSSRYGKIHEYIFEKTQGKDPTTRKGRKEFKLFDISQVDYSVFTDDELVQLFERIVRRSAIQM